MLLQALGQLLRELVLQNRKLDRIEGKVDKFMNDFATDETRLEADIQANTDAITKVGTLVSQDTATIADLNSQVAALKAATPTVDTTALEMAIGKLEANNAALTGLAPATPAAS